MIENLTEFKRLFPPWRFPILGSQKIVSLKSHSCGSRNPVFPFWIPTFVGMTTKEYVDELMTQELFMAIA
jgi:hypothetical protein